MPAAFEYRICKVGLDRVCEVNGEWQGKSAQPDLEQTKEALHSSLGGSNPGLLRSLFSRGKVQPEQFAATISSVHAAYYSCPEELEYLQEAGEQGWELVAVISTSKTHQNADADDAHDFVDNLITEDYLITHTLYLKRLK